MKARALFVGLVIGTMILLLARGAAASASEQIVFSAQNPPSTGSFTVAPSGPTTPFGFWIWCEASAQGGSYVGVCSGAMYFYALGIIKGVAGNVVELSSGAYQMTVSSTDGKVSSCVLTNHLPVTSGSTNTIDVTCTLPAGSGMATNAVVQVTGG